MIFNSVSFIIFFIIITGIYVLIPQRLRWVLLLSASYIFYMTLKAEYALLLFSATAVSYGAGILMSAFPSPKIKKGFLLAGLSINLGLLFVFKYVQFICTSIQDILRYTGLPAPVPAVNILLPVGISFYMFRTVSYLIDVYRGTMAPEKHFGVFALYVAFFPSLLAGPIDRATQLLPQFDKKYRFDSEGIYTGIQLFSWGLFKKVVIADRLALYVDSIFNNVPHHSGPSYLLAAYFYTFQIYCDFSGYSDMAIGCAKILGFDLMQNFNLPYFATTIGDFWRRWHISLSTWFRDYVYIPLGGNRRGQGRTSANLIV